MGNDHKSRVEILDAEIEELENAMHGVEADETKQATDTEEVVSEEVSAGTEEEVNEEVFEATDETEETAEVLEATEEVEEETKPKRVQWKKKYNEEQEKWNKHRATLDNTIFQLRQQLTSQSDIVSGLYEKIEVLSKAVAESTSSDINSHFSQEDRDILGDDAINAMSKVMDTKVAPLQEELEARKAADRKRAKEAAEFQAQEANRLFKQRLASAVQNLDAIDADPAFMEYLKETDPINGGTRFDWFKDAQARGNVKEVASYFHEYENITRGPQRILEDKITPMPQGGTGDSINPQAQARPQGELTPYSEIEAFHDSVVSGNFRGTAAERDALDIKYDRAWAEQRVDFSR